MAVTGHEHLDHQEEEMLKMIWCCSQAELRERTTPGMDTDFEQSPSIKFCDRMSIRASQFWY